MRTISWAILTCRETVGSLKCHMDDPATNERSDSSRLQSGQHHLSIVLHAQRDPRPVSRQETRSGRVAADSDVVVVDRGLLSVLAIGEEVVSGLSGFDWDSVWGVHTDGRFVGVLGREGNRKKERR